MTNGPNQGRLGSSIEAGWSCQEECKIYRSRPFPHMAKSYDLTTEIMSVVNTPALVQERGGVTDNVAEIFGGWYLVVTLILPLWYNVY